MSDDISFQTRICPTCHDDHSSGSACDINDIFQIKEVREELDANYHNHKLMVVKIKKLQEENKKLRACVEYFRDNGIRHTTHISERARACLKELDGEE